MTATATTPVKGGRKTVPSAQPNNAGYADRPYERNLTQKGRRFISVDLDASVLERVDQLRGKDRRGIFLDQLLDAAITNLGKPEATMR
jgi:hypothetical protein